MKLIPEFIACCTEPFHAGNIIMSTLFDWQFMIQSVKAGKINS